MKGRGGMKHEQCGEGHWGYSVETREGQAAVDRGSLVRNMFIF